MPAHIVEKSSDSKELKDAAVALSILVIVAVSVGLLPVLLADFAARAGYFPPLTIYVSLPSSTSKPLTLLCTSTEALPATTLHAANFTLYIKSKIGLAPGLYEAEVKLGGVKLNASCAQLLGYYEGKKLELSINNMYVVGARYIALAYYSGPKGRVVILPSWALLVLFVAAVSSAATILALKELGRHWPNIRAVWGIDETWERVLFAAPLTGDIFLFLLVAGYPTLAMHTFSILVLLVAYVLSRYAWARLKASKSRAFVGLTAIIALITAILFAMSQTAPIAAAILLCMLLVTAIVLAAPKPWREKLYTQVSAVLVLSIISTLMVKGLLVALLASPLAAASSPILLVYIEELVLRLRRYSGRLWTLILAFNALIGIGIALLYLYAFLIAPHGLCPNLLKLLPLAPVAVFALLGAVKQVCRLGRLVATLREASMGAIVATLAFMGFILSYSFFFHLFFKVPRLYVACVLDGLWASLWIVAFAAILSFLWLLYRLYSNAATSKLG